MNFLLNVKRRIKFILVILLTATLIPLTTEAIPYGFTRTTNNTELAPQIANQLNVEIGTNKNYATFNIYNLGPISSSITGSYFYFNQDCFTLGNASIENGPGVLFSEINPTSNFVGGGTFNFDTTTHEFSADSEDNGINPLEFVSIKFDLTDKMSLKDFKEYILSRDLMIGLQVQIQDSEGNTSTGYFINFTKQIPEPSLIILLGSLIFGAGWLDRKRFIK